MQVGSLLALINANLVSGIITEKKSTFCLLSLSEEVGKHIKVTCINNLSVLMKS